MWRQRFIWIRRWTIHGDTGSIRMTKEETEYTILLLSPQWADLRTWGCNFNRRWKRFREWICASREILHSQLRNQTICNMTVEMERRDCGCILGSHWRLKMMRRAAFSGFKAVKYVALVINQHPTWWESPPFKKYKKFRHDRTQKVKA